MKTYHRFAIAAPMNDDEEPRLFKTRDGGAFWELTGEFSLHGYQPGSLIYNYPFSPRFSVDHMKDLAGFARRITHPATTDGISKFLCENISSGSKDVLTRVAASGASYDARRDLVVDDLNDFVDGERLDVDDRFDGLRLSTVTEDLKSHNFLGKKQVARLNRHLLEDAYRDELGRVHDILRLGQENFSFLRGKTDVLVLTTRPPLDDERHEDRKYVARSHTDLENAIFESLRQYIAECARTRIRLAHEMALHLNRKAAKKAEMEFHQNKDARLLRCHSLDQPSPSPVGSDQHLTAGFFVHVPHIVRYGCPLIASFGMGGYETLIWNAIVRRHPNYKRWITEPVFVAAILDLTKLPPRPITLDFTDQIGVEIFLEQPLAG